MDVYGHKGTRTLDKLKAKRFIADALREYDSTLTVTDAELGSILEKLSPGNTLNTEDIALYFNSIGGPRK